MIVRMTAFRNRLKRSSMAHRFIHGASWGIFGSITAQGLGLVTMLFVARLLGKESYGQFVLIQSTLAMFGTFAGFGIGNTATRYVAAFRNKDKVRLGHILALSERTVLVFGLIIAVTISLFSQQLAATALNDRSLSTPLSVASVAVLFTTVDGYQKSVLVGFEAMRVYAKCAIAGVMVGAPIMLIGAAQYGLEGVAYAFALSTLIRAVISRKLATVELRRNKITVDAKGCLKEWLILRDFALPALMSGAMLAPVHWVCQAMLANTQNGFAELAVLGVAMQWFSAVLFLPTVAGKIVTPILTESMTSGNHNDSKQVLILAMKANAIVALPTAGAIAVLSPWLLSLYGAGFQDGALVLTIAVFTASLSAILAPVGSMVAAASRMWLGFLMNLGWAVIYIGMAVALLGYGAAGVITSLGVAYIFHATWTFAFAFLQIKSLNHK